MTAPGKNSERPLRIAVPKKGRLCAAFNEAMDSGGLRIEKVSPRHDFGMLRDRENTLQNIEALTMRSTDALRAVAAGAADMAVVGLDMLREFNAQNDGLAGADIVPLGLTPCALYIAAAPQAGIENAGDLRDMRIATSFPGVLATWLAQNDVRGVTIVECEGGVEDMVRLGLADAVCDLVETGGTLAANGLEKRLKVMDSEAVLVIAETVQNPAMAAAVSAQVFAAARCAVLVPA